MSRGAGRDRLMLELRRASFPALLFLILILAGVYAGVTVMRNLASDKPWVSYKPYDVAFESVKGVVPGRAELRIAGVKAGSVKDARLVDGQAVLTLNVEKKYAPLKTDAKVVIRPVTALEDVYVDVVSRGSKNAPEIKSGQILAESRTESQTEVGRVLNVLESDTRAQFSNLLDQLGAGTKDRGERMRQAFTELGPFLRAAADLGDALQDRRQNTKALVHNFGNLTTVLATRDKQLAGFVDNGGKLLGELAEHDGTLAATIARLPGTLRNAQTTFASLRGTTVPLDAALKSLRPVAKSLPDGLESLRSFSNDATPAVRSLRPSVTALRPLARELRRTSANGAAALTPLVSQFKQLEHGTKIVEPCLPTAFSFVTRTPSVLKYTGTGGVSNDVRALATVDLNGVVNNSNSPLKDLFEPIAPPCFVDPEKANRAASVATPIPSRDAAVSKEQNR